MSDHKFDELRRRLLDIQGELLRLCAETLHALDEAEEENRRLRGEAQMTHLEVFTETEAAKVLRMSAATLARLRESEHLPHFRAGMLVRYTNRHLAEITELLAARQKIRGRKSSR
jgi:hypothetical protein